MTQQTNSSLLEKIRIVMVNTSHPGNIGAAARAMKNMGLTKLYLVEPKDFPSIEAISRSVGALNILDDAVVVDSLDAAVSDCIWVAGTSARLRTIQWSTMQVRECVEQAVDYLADGEIAIVFGNETSGLSNEEMDRCNVLLHIPTNPDFSSLNIAAAVQVVCYEFRQAMSIVSSKRLKGSKHRHDALANASQLDDMYTHLQDSLVPLGFFGTKNPDVIMRRLKGLFNRASTTQREVSIIRGICSSIQGKKERK